jgi:4-alpha-glucanotransferase
MTSRVLVEEPAPRSLSAYGKARSHNFVSNTVAYTGTHDNPPTREWYEQLPDSQKETLWSYINRRLVNSAEAAPALIELAWSSITALTIAPLQDVLALGVGTRMNVPGRVHGNWRWRFTEEKLSTTAFRMAVRIDRKVEASRERAFKRSAAEGGRRRANGSM